MKKLFGLLVMVLVLLPLCAHAADCDHVWAWEQRRFDGIDYYHIKRCQVEGCGAEDAATLGEHIPMEDTCINTTCKTCGLECFGTKDHTWSDWYMVNEERHQHKCQEIGCGVTYTTPHTFDDDADMICDTCGYTRGGAHEHYGGTATCTEQAVCEGCGESYGEVDPNAHDWGEWVFEGPLKVDGHRRTCKRDRYHYEQKEHTGGNPTCSEWATCEGCGGDYIDENNHAYDTTDWGSYDDTKHVKLCEGCKHVVDRAEHVFDSDADATCNDCGYTRTVQTPTPRPTPKPTPRPVTPPPHVHEYSAATCVKPATCACGATTGEPDPNGHGWQEWVSNGDGTHMRRCWRNYNHKEIRDCTDGSNQDGVCNLCGDEMLHTLHTLIWACEQRTTERMTIDGQIKAVEGHYQQCTGCDYRTEYEFHQGTCTMLEKDEEGYEAYHRIECDICNVTTLEDHYYVTLYDDTHHWRTCPCGYANEQETNLVPHEFAYRQSDDAGSEKYCTDCDWVDAEQTP